MPPADSGHLKLSHIRILLVRRLVRRLVLRLVLRLARRRLTDHVGVDHLLPGGSGQRVRSEARREEDDQLAARPVPEDAEEREGHGQGARRGASHDEAAQAGALGDGGGEEGLRGGGGDEAVVLVGLGGGGAEFPAGLRVLLVRGPGDG